MSFKNLTDARRVKSSNSFLEICKKSYEQTVWVSADRQSPPGQEGAVRLIQPTSYLASKDLSRSIDSTPAVNNEMPPKLNRATRAMRNAGNKEQTYLRNRTVNEQEFWREKSKRLKWKWENPRPSLVSSVAEKARQTKSTTVLTNA